jgi:hypothetical protein
LGTLVFNLWLNYPETQILADPNDNIFQYSLVWRTNWVWENYGCPFSLSCLPNLTDHIVSVWAEGYSLPVYYSHLPQMSIVSSYNMLVKPVTNLFGMNYSLYQYYNLTKYLLLCLFPLSVFFALRLVGFSYFGSGIAAWLSGNFSTDGLYGIDPTSFLWRGWGLTSQLYAQVYFPLAIAYVYKALKEVSVNGKETKVKYLNKNSLLAIVFLILTLSGHLGIGMLVLISTVPFFFMDLNKIHLINRFKTLLIIYLATLGILSYWIIPIFSLNNYHMVSPWDPLWKFNSYGWYEVIRQFIQGEAFDWNRTPIITYIIIFGFFIILSNSQYFTFALLFVLWFLLYFGRTTWGGLVDLIPGMKDYHQHRFIVGLQLSALFLLPAVFEYSITLFKLTFGRIFASLSLIKIRLSKNTFLIGQNITIGILMLISTSAVVYYTVGRTLDYAQSNNKWIYEANNAYNFDVSNFDNLRKYIESQPKARIYAGRPGNWGKDFRLGSSQIYMLFGALGYDISQFLPETWSPLSENEQNFDERNAADYDLLNLKYIVAPKNQGFTEKAVLDKKFGPFELYQVPTTGWFDVVTSPMMVKTDKTHFINIVHYWHRSFARRWKMHPIITVEKNDKPPTGVSKILHMLDEVNYKEEYQDGSLSTEKNIWADYPFIFPESTPSSTISKEIVDKQKYSAVIEVPQDCKNCLVMFKMSYHPSWRVKVDGEARTKLAVFPFYNAVAVTPGVHTVEFSYHPNTLKTVLLYLTIFGGLGFLIFTLLRKFKRR